MRFLNAPRVVPSRTSLARSAPNSTLKMASGLASSMRLHDRAGVDLAERRRLLGDELDVGLRLLQHRLEGSPRPTGRTRSSDRPAPSASSWPRSRRGISIATCM